MGARKHRLILRYKSGADAFFNNYLGPAPVNELPVEASRVTPPQAVAAYSNSNRKKKVDLFPCILCVANRSILQFWHDVNTCSSIMMPYPLRGPGLRHLKEENVRNDYTVLPIVTF